ncbi:MAG: DUF5906 domain-containing protein, partial [Candidatus Babeliales bacterium]|nr:DUF5906 domain-containing protein [Candidatus Babeliales bacterium]
MVKNSVEKIKQTKEAKDIFIDEFINSYDDEDMKMLYSLEIEAHKKYVKSLVASLYVDKETVTKADITAITKNISCEEYEKNFKETTKYIKNRIWHGYDSKFYVSCKNAQGSFLAYEYANADFCTTFKNYFPDEIKAWFDKYSTKFTLTLDNSKPRSYKSNGSNFLNLFSGFRFDKHGLRDEERIKKGIDGVKFIWNHIYEIWNTGNKQNFEYDQNWVRKMVAGFKLNTLIYLKSKMGKGKGKITTFFMNVLGKQVCIPLNNDKPFTGEFNGSLLGKAFCLLDEIVHDFDDFKTLYNQLKPYITEPNMSYRNLYEKLKTLTNVTSFIMSGNYDMLKLDDPSKGDDRRIKVNEVSNEVKNQNYCDLLDGYCENEDVMYAFFWDCIDNHNPEWNELAELKLLPITETKIQMIQQSLDTVTLFFKSIVNSEEWMNTYVKPKEFYSYYVDWMSTDDTVKLKKPMNSSSFLSKIKDSKEFVTYHEKIRVGDANQTNYYRIDREKLIAHYKFKHFWNEMDEIDVEIENEKQPDNTLVGQLKKQIEELQKKQQIESMRKDIEWMQMTNNMLQNHKPKSKFPTLKQQPKKAKKEEN